MRLARPLALALLTACGGEDLSVDSGSGGQAGADTAGQGGAGAGGQAGGAPGISGSSGQSGAAGSAGLAGTGGASGSGISGTSGQAGADMAGAGTAGAGTAGKGGAAGAGTAGVAGGSVAGAAGAAGGAGAGGGGGSSGGDPGCGSLHVDGSKGDDGNDGCSPGAPVKTIGHALALAAAAPAAKPVTTVKVCARTYHEGVTLAAPVSLEGGYDCATWKRPDDLGYPFDKPFAMTTTIDGSVTVGGIDVTLQIQGAGIGPAVTVSGFLLQSQAPSGTASTMAVQVTDGARPTLHDNRVLGAAPAADLLDVRTVGMHVTGGAAPTVSRSVIAGGSGRRSAAGSRASLGLLIDGAETGGSFVDDRIDGGTGRNTVSGAGSVGVAVENVNSQAVPPVPLVIDQCTISGGGGSTVVSVASVGMTVTAVHHLTVRGSTIRSGVGRAEDNATTVSSYGLLATLSGDLDVVGNRILVEAPTIKSGITASLSALHLDQVEQVRVHSNVVSGPDSAPAKTSVLALEIVAATTPASPTIVSVPTKQVSVINNTVLAGNHGLGTSSVALAVIGPQQQLVINGNLLVGMQVSGGLDSFPFYIGSCTRGSVASFVGNALVAPVGGSVLATNNQSTVGPVCTQEVVLYSGISAESFLLANGTPAIAPGQLSVIRDVCEGADSTCTAVAACNQTATCLSQIFGAINSSKSASAALADGLTLSPKTPCSLRNRGAASSLDMTDLAGTARETPYSIGAHEFAGDNKAGCP